MGAVTCEGRAPGKRTVAQQLRKCAWLHTRVCQVNPDKPALSEPKKRRESAVADAASEVTLQEDIISVAFDQTLKTSGPPSILLFHCYSAAGLSSGAKYHSMF